MAARAARTSTKSREGPAALHPRSRTNADNRWAPAARHPHSQKNADSRCALAVSTTRSVDPLPAGCESESEK